MCRYVLYHHSRHPYGCSLSNMHPASDRSIRCYPDIVVYDIRSGNIYTPGNHDISTYFIIVGDMAQVIDFRVIPYNGISQGPSVNTGIGTDFHKITHNQLPDLRKTESITIHITFIAKSGSS
ncbi:MAG: hypothetical protein AUK63_44 [bacterium P3]|nr:MAG: hypothetical protein AUK63_44 [bacterium P3]